MGGRMVALGIVTLAACVSGGGDDDPAGVADAAAGDAPATAGDAGAVGSGAVDAGVVDAADGDAADVDAGAVDAADGDAGAVDAADGDGCAVPGSASWTGTARLRYLGSSGYSETAATLEWQRIDTIDCVDRFAPSGTAHWDWVGGLCETLSYQPEDHPIDSGDGELVIDRSAVPARYAMTGTTEWPVTVTCVLDGEPEITASQGGGAWADGGGSVEDGQIAGQVTDGNVIREWRVVSSE